ARVAQVLGFPVELALGVDFDLEAGTRREQLYVFCGDGRRQGALLEHVLHEAETEPGTAASLQAWLRSREGELRLSLMAMVPKADAEGVDYKLYFDASRAIWDDEEQLIAPNMPVGDPLAAFIPRRGLAVLELEA